MNDYIFAEIRKKKNSFEFSDIVSETGLDLEQLQRDYRSESALKRLETDIRSGLRLNITSTPAFLIGETVFEGTVPADILAPYQR